MSSLDAVPPVHVVVVGGGIAGLSAALSLRTRWAAADQRRELRITVLEGSPRLGGVLAAGEVAGVPVDLGAESMLARRPEAVALARQVGLGDRLEEPRTTAARVLSRGRLRRLPPASVMGIPTAATALGRSGVLSAGERAVLRAHAHRPLAPLSEDISVGAYVRAGLGDAVVDRLVEPLLGGVYAGRADALSLRATLPALARVAAGGGPVREAAERVRLAGVGVMGPVFMGLGGGIASLVPATAAASGAEVELSTVVRQVRRLNGGWELVTGSAASPGFRTADAVILAVPAAAAARLLTPIRPVAGALLAEIETASVAIVTLALRDATLPSGSGLLVPPVEGRLTKAATFSSQKWGWSARAAGPLTVLRASVGRAGEQVALARNDADLVAVVSRELAELAGVRGVLVDSVVTRWGGGLPQYAVGHVERVAAIREALADVPGSAALAVCGATYDGVGIPATVASADAAAECVMRALLARGGTPAGVGGQSRHG